MKRPVSLIAFFLIVAGLLWWVLGSTADSGSFEAETAEAASSPGSTRGIGLRGRAANADGPPIWKQNTASVSGRAVDEQGRGVAAARVCAVTESKELSQAQTREYNCVKTVADGHFRLENLYPVRYGFSAQAAEHVPGRWRDGDRRTMELGAGEEKTGLEIVLEGGGVPIHGVVKDIAGGVVAGAWVKTGAMFFGGGNDGDAIAQTDDEGAFTLWVRAGQVGLNAHAEGYADAFRSGVAPGYEFELHLAPESVLTGRVVWADSGEPVEGAKVMQAQYSQAIDFTDENGRFRLEGLDPGRYKPLAIVEGGYGESEVSVHLGLSEQSAEIVIQVHPAGALRGRVLVNGKDETPCSQGSVNLSVKDGRRGRRKEIATDGTVTFEGLIPATYSVRVNCEKHMPSGVYEPIEIKAGPAQEREWTVEPGRGIRGRVVDASGTPVSKASVSARIKQVEGRQQTTSGWTTVESDGTFEITGLLAGEYDVEAKRPTDAGLEAKQTVTISEAADVDGLVLEIPEGGTIRGTVTDADGRPVAGVSVRIEGPGRSWMPRSTDDTGRFEYTGLRPGHHRLSATEGMWGKSLRSPGTGDDDVQGESVDLEAGGIEEVALVVESRGGEISGRVTDDGGGPVVDAFVRADRESDSAAAGKGQNLQSARWGQWNETPVLTDQDGRFTLSGLPQDMQFTVYAHRKGGGEGFVEHVSEGSQSVEVTITPTGRIAGQVVSAPEEFTVSAVDKQKSIRRSETFYRTDGAFAFERLPAGHYEVTAAASVGDAKTEAELPEGGAVEDLKLELTRRVTVRGKVVDAETKEPVSGLRVSIATRGGGFGFSMGADHGEDAKFITDDDGRFEVENAPIGEARVVVIPRNWGASDYSFTTKRHEIPDEDPVELETIEILKKRMDQDEQAGDVGFQLKRNDAGKEWDEGNLVIAVVRPGGPAQQAGIVSGDVIETVDGHDVAADRSRYGTLTRVKAGTKLTFGLAGDKTVTLVVGKPI